MRNLHGKQTTLRRLLLSASALTLSALVLTSCTLVPDDEPTSSATSNPSPSASEMTAEEEAALTQIYTHIGQSDPQIIDILSVGFTSSEQGQNMIIDVLFSDTDPITSETLTNILIAASEIAPEDTYQISVAAHPVSDPSSIRSLEEAAMGLPDWMNWQWTGWELHVYDVGSWSQGE